MVPLNVPDRGIRHSYEEVSEGNEFDKEWFRNRGEMHEIR